MCDLRLLWKNPPTRHFLLSDFFYSAKYTPCDYSKWNKEILHSLISFSPIQPQGTHSGDGWNFKGKLHEHF